MSESGRLRWHEDPEAFRDLLTLTAARAGFLAALRSQLDTALKPVLRAADFETFDLNRAFATVAAVAGAIARTP